MSERLLRDKYTIAEHLTLSILLVASIVLFTVADPRLPGLWDLF